MRTYDYISAPAALLTPEISGLLSAIHECKGRQQLYLQAKPDVLETLCEVAKIQSTEASNKIEGIFTSASRLKALVEKKTLPRNRNEQEIAGYRDVLATVHENHDYLPVTPGAILQLHRDLCAFLAQGIGGHWKNSDNVIAETAADGSPVVRFRPVPAFQTPEAMEALCAAHKRALDAATHAPLLLMPMFVLDFLCIHPFNDGNGRMSRLLTLLLLYKAGFIVGKYISLEMLIEKTKVSYYDALQSSSAGWHEGTNDYKPFVQYTLGVLLKAYREFETRVEDVFITRTKKSDRIRMVFDKKAGKVSKQDILDSCPDISQAMVEKTLHSLLASGAICKIGTGRNTTYIRS